MQTPEMRRLEELKDARDAGKVIEEVLMRELINTKIIDIFRNVYSIPETISNKYILENTEFIDNVMDRIDEGITRELEEFVSSCDILLHQKGV